MTMLDRSLTLDRFLTVPPAELVRRRHQAVTAFLAERGLTVQWLASFMAQQVGSGQLLLTSSPVHGLANPSSDFDFIRIQDEPIDGPRIATKIFERGHHLEVVSFSSAELNRNLDELHALAARPPAEVVAGFRSWDRRFEPRRKQTERIVNGLTLDGTAPYLDWLPALGLVWSRAALHTAIEQVTHLCLAEAAGERRGRVGYAVNTLLHLMDALLSLHGDVYTTRKWYLLRWRRFLDGGAWHDGAFRAAAQSLELLRRDVAGALSPGAGPDLAGPYVELAAEVARACGVADRITVCPRLVAGVRYHPFLPGAGLLVSPAGAVPVHGPPPAEPAELAEPTGQAEPAHQAEPTEPIELVELPAIDAGRAGTLLRAARAGLAEIAVGYHGEPHQPGASP